MVRRVGPAQWGEALKVNMKADSLWFVPPVAIVLGAHDFAMQQPASVLTSIHSVLPNGYKDAGQKKSGGFKFYSPCRAHGCLYWSDAHPFAILFLNR